MLAVHVACSGANAAPDFKATEKTVYMRAKERAGEMGETALDKARELKEKATGAPKTN
jgi:hypothetical protein